MWRFNTDDTIRRTSESINSFPRLQLAVIVNDSHVGLGTTEIIYSFNSKRRAAISRSAIKRSSSSGGTSLSPRSVVIWAMWERLSVWNFSSLFLPMCVWTIELWRIFYHVCFLGCCFSMKPISITRRPFSGPLFFVFSFNRRRGESLTLPDSSVVPRRRERAHQQAPPRCFVWIIHSTLQSYRFHLKVSRHDRLPLEGITDLSLVLGRYSCPEERFPPKRNDFWVSPLVLANNLMALVETLISKFPVRFNEIWVHFHSGIELRGH